MWNEIINKITSKQKIINKVSNSWPAVAADQLFPRILQNSGDGFRRSRTPLARHEVSYELIRHNDSVQG